jgi:hypothetical protein
MRECAVARPTPDSSTAKHADAGFVAERGHGLAERIERDRHQRELAMLA